MVGEAVTLLFFDHRLRRPQITKLAPNVREVAGWRPVRDRENGPTHNLRLSR